MNKSASIPTFKPGDQAYFDMGNDYHVQGTVEDVEPGRRKLTWKVDKPAAPNSPATCLCWRKWIRPATVQLLASLLGMVPASPKWCT